MSTFTTPTGDIIEFQRDGAPDGRPVLAHHGLISGASFGPDWSAAAARHGIELIGVARPGYGGSTPVAMRSVAEWAPVATTLLDHLGFDSVGVLGLSAGAPYAYALAAMCPDRVDRVAVLSGVPRVCDAPVLAEYDDAARDAYESYRVGTLEEVAAGYAAMLGARSAELAPDDPWQVGIRASLAHDGLGPAREAKLQIADWGFDQADVKVPVVLWHSVADEMVPAAAAALMPATMPDARLEVQAEPGHLPSIETLDAALAFLAHG